MAPTQSEAPFRIAQLAILVLFLLLGIFAAKGYRNEQVVPLDPSG